MPAITAIAPFSDPALAAPPDAAPRAGVSSTGAGVGSVVGVVVGVGSGVGVVVGWSAGSCGVGSVTMSLNVLLLKSVSPVRELSVKLRLLSSVAGFKSNVNLDSDCSLRVSLVQVSSAAIEVQFQSLSCDIPCHWEPPSAVATSSSWFLHSA